MAMIRPFEGSLFAEDFLRGAIAELPDWRDLADPSRRGGRTNGSRTGD